MVVPPSSSASSALLHHNVYLQEQLVLHYCQLWLLKEDEKRLRLRLNDSANVKEHCKVTLASAIRELVRGKTLHKKKLEEITDHEMVMRKELDDVSFELLYVRKTYGERNEKVIQCNAKRDKLWEQLEMAILHRNAVMTKVSSIDRIVQVRTDARIVSSTVYRAASPRYGTIGEFNHH